MQKYRGNVKLTHIGGLKVKDIAYIGVFVCAINTSEHWNVSALIRDSLSLNLYGF